MDWGAIFFILALLIMTVLFLSQPFFNRETKSRSIVEQHFSDDSRNVNSLWSLEERRDQLLGALQDLEYDREMGKMPVDDYMTQREGLLDAGVKVIQQIRVIRPTTTPALIDANPHIGTSNSLSRSLRFPNFEEDELEEMIKTYRRTRQEKAIGLCPRCWKAIKQSDRYCAQCGAPVETEKLLKNL